jgi:hypothetical protein
VSDLCAVLDADTAPRQSDTAPGLRQDTAVSALGNHLAAATLSAHSFKPPPESSVPSALESAVIAGPFPSEAMPSDHIVVRATLRLSPPRV